MPLRASVSLSVLSASGFTVGQSTPASIWARFFFEALCGTAKKTDIVSRTGSDVGHGCPAAAIACCAA